jgi:hypothetical protein
MGQKGGPNIPIESMQFAFDPRNPKVLSGSYKTLIDDDIATVIGAALSGTGYTLGINFSSATDSLDFGNLTKINLTSNITVMGWVYPKSFGGGSSGRIFDKFKTTVPQTGYALWIDNNIGTNAIAYGTGWTVNTSVARLSNQVDLSTWQHFAVTHSGTTVTFYKNGASIGTSSSITAPSSGSVVARIGNNAGGTNNFDGTLGAVRIYNKVLSATEILQIYNSTRSKYGL